MGDYEKIIEVLERLKATILEVRSKFSQAAEILNRRQAWDLTQVSEDDNIINYLTYKPNSALTYCDELIKFGDFLKNIVTSAQVKFLRAVNFINSKPAYALTEEQVVKIQQEINQAVADIVTYNELLRRLYEAIGISNPEA